MLSAQLDGEDDPADRPRVDEHLAGCAGCREWLDRAAAINRLTSTAPATTPDLTAAILAALPAAPSRRLSLAPTDQPASAEARRPGLVARFRSAARMPGAGVPGSSAGASEAAAPGSSGGTPFARVVHSVDRTPLGRFVRSLRRFPLAVVLLVALAAVGAVQLILGLDQIGGGVAGAHPHSGTEATPGHLWHESAAWNVAVGAGYLFIALRRTRPSGLVPMLTAFVGMLLLLSVNDLTAGRVDATRLVSHGFVILGYLLIVALSRIPGGFVATPPGARVDAGSGWRASFADGEDEGSAETFRPQLRLVPRGPMTAEHDERRAA